MPVCVCVCWVSMNACACYVHPTHSNLHTAPTHPHMTQSLFNSTLASPTWTRGTPMWECCSMTTAQHSTLWRPPSSSKSWGPWYWTPSATGSDHPQVVRVGNNTSVTLTLNTGAPQGCVLSLLLYSLFNHNCVTWTWALRSSIKLYSCTIENILTGCITTWYDNCLAFNDKESSLSSRTSIPGSARGRPYKLSKRLQPPR